ncbi:VOC family protein [bacterium]|nr:VOC family protein [bacterium]
MSRVGTYLNFQGNAEAAFEFYKSVFGGEFQGNGYSRFKDVPAQEGMPPLSDADKNLVMQVALPILDGHMLMGCDAPASMGFSVKPGNNVYISLAPTTRSETERLFNALSQGGSVEMPLADMFWGAYFGSCTDQFGISWMVNCEGGAH